MAKTLKIKGGIFVRSIEIQNEQDLIQAATVGDIEKLQELIESGVSVDTKELKTLSFYTSKNFMTPLQIAAANGYEKCVQILIDHGADVNAQNRFDITALHMAAEKGHYFCIKLLLRAGADCCVPTKFSKWTCYTAVPYLMGTTPLHLAAVNNHINCVKELMLCGADYNAVDEHGRTSLYIAAEAGFDGCVLAHLKNAIGKRILSIPSFKTSDTPLHFAVRYNMLDCVKELLKLSSDVSHRNCNGRSPLHCAVTFSTDENTAVKMEILKLLVLEGYNANINCCDAFDFIPLHYVCFNSYYCHLRRRSEMAKFLIAHGADVNIKNKQGYSLLECELISPDKNSEILRYLVRSMLHLPRLETLRVDPHRHDRYNRQIIGHLGFRNAHREIHYDYFDVANFPDMPEFVLPRGYRHFEMNLFEENIAPAVIPEQMRNHHLHQRMSQYVRYAHQPHLMHEHDAVEEINNERNLPENENNVEGNLPFESSHDVEKYLWYKEKASNPRTLKHNCRYVIRKCMGASKMKYIRCLPIPILFKSYLLLETD